MDTWSMDMDTLTVEYEPMDIWNYGLHLEVIWTTSGSDLYYMWKSCGLHLDVIWMQKWSLFAIFIVLGLQSLSF